ncbi:Short-chain dehydrogenase/reductase SDR [Penicillium brevicompactum]|uniref:uncharacterized protein n=1 Tax=Penicillium brevicompactum TaxID=5074 RepID=UPI0025422E92|nr:uncharacterized protein N7506_005874 [Penicillium brevicompactum]KAJ5332091.1 hypothetical protein N7506_005874 [Penicillium brevicompactum]
MPRVWLITGSSSGFGREIALAAADIGDTVVATSRYADKLKDLEEQRPGQIVLHQLDVNGSDDTVQAQVASILEKVGRIDVLVNNAGYILEGAVEECSGPEAEAVFATNVFGQMRVLRAVLPSMRKQKPGVVANLGSIGGWSGTPAAGLYCATKAAVAIYTEALCGELAPFGIEATCIEPGYFRTNFLSGGHKVVAQNRLPELDIATESTRAGLAAYNHHQPGDPAKGARVIVEALTKTGRCEGRKLPPRLALGRDAITAIRAAMARNQEGLDQWQDVVMTTDHDDVAN